MKAKRIPHNKTSLDIEKKIVEMYNNNLTIKYIESIFNVSNRTIFDIIKRNGYEYKNKRNNIKDGFLTNTNDKINCYLLGFLWADGWISDKGYTHSVNMALKKDDFEMIEPLLKNNGINCIYVRQRYQNGKKFGKVSKLFRLHNKDIVSFLINNDYKIKSYISPTKILSIIPQNLKHYFWRGYVDGDGCIMAKRGHITVALWSTINQDWSELIKLFNLLGIGKYYFHQYSRKNGKHQSSTVSISSSKNVKLFCDYIYQEYDDIGLKRKYERYLNILELIPTLKLSKTSKYKGVCFNKRNGKWKSQWYNPITKKDIHLGWFDTEENAYQKRLHFLI